MLCQKSNSVFLQQHWLLPIQLDLSYIHPDFISTGSIFCDCLLRHSTDNTLQLSDIGRLGNVFTYCSDNDKRISWLDHQLCSTDVDKLVSCVYILYDLFTSDHKPLIVTFHNLHDLVSASDRPKLSYSGCFRWANSFCINTS